MNKKNLILIAFAISGFTALVYEVVWVRPLQLIFGSTIYAALFGMIWPIANRAYTTNEKEKWGKDIGILYSANSFGSFLGPLAAGFLLIPMIGIRASAIFTASLNLLAAITIFSYIRLKKDSSGDKLHKNNHPTGAGK